MGSIVVGDTPDPGLIQTCADLGVALSFLRERAGLSVRELAGRVDSTGEPIGTSAVGDWCAGRRLPQVSRLPTFRRVLDQLGVQDHDPWVAALARARADPSRERHEPRGIRSTAVPAPPQARPLNVVGLGLPADTGHLTGRGEELDEIIAAMEGGPNQVVVVHGMAGAGKTTLAIRAARLLADRFPDGCLFVDLRGQESPARAVPAAEALDRLLRRLGVGGAQVPRDADDRASLLRERMTGRRMLLVLDDARDAAHVRPLLPSEPRCGAIVTSRNHLVALDEAHPVAVGLLTPDDAAVLFHAVVQPLRLGPEAVMHVQSIVRSCGYLPLAIRIAAARFRADPTSLADLAGRLADARDRLNELDDGERSVVASIRASLLAVPDSGRSLFDALVRFPGPDIEGLAAAALAGQRRPDTARRLDGLVARHVLERRPRGRYRLHDLVRDVARQHLGPDQQPAEDHAVEQRRLVDFYLTAADLADRTITPHRHRVPLDVAHPPDDLPDLDRYDDALAWFLDEEDNLVAVCEQAGATGLDTACWQLAFTLRGYFFLTKRWAAWEATHDHALAATRRLEDRRAEAMTLNNLGLVAIEQEQLELAATRYEEALGLFRQVGDASGEHTTIANRAWLLFFRGDFEGFLHESGRAYDYYHREGAERNAAITLRGIALAELELGRLEVAVRHFHEALEAFERLGLRLDAAMTLNSLGETSARRQRPGEAVEQHRRALTEALGCGSPSEQARAHLCLGDLAATAEDLSAAQDHWHQALRIYRDLGAPQATDVADRLNVSEPA